MMQTLEPLRIIGNAHCFVKTIQLPKLVYDVRVHFMSVLWLHPFRGDLYLRKRLLWHFIFYTNYKYLLSNFSSHPSLAPVTALIYLAA
jgi:hypothetical protein